jgi:hypothetical protein
MGVKEHQKVGVVCNSLEGEADHFYWYLEQHARKEEGYELTWSAFQQAFIDKFERTNSRRDLLRQQLKSVKFNGISHMAEYIEHFRKVEI